MNLNFARNQDSLIPAVIQDSMTLRVLMLGYMNRDAFEKTVKEGKVTFYSRSKKRLWTKGETSGNTLLLDEIQLDCDSDTLLILARPTGPVCHTGTHSCFGEKSTRGFLYHLQSIIDDRQNDPVEGSYTTRLFTEGINKIAQKVGEEATELIIEAKDSNDDLFKNEAADLLYHLLVLFTEKGCNIHDIEAVLAERHK